MAEIPLKLNFTDLANYHFSARLFVIQYQLAENEIPDYKLVIDAFDLGSFKSAYQSLLDNNGLYQHYNNLTYLIYTLETDLVDLPKIYDETKQAKEIIDNVIDCFHLISEKAAYEESSYIKIRGSHTSNNSIKSHHINFDAIEKDIEDAKFICGDAEFNYSLFNYFLGKDFNYETVLEAQKYFSLRKASPKAYCVSSFCVRIFKYISDLKMSHFNNSDIYRLIYDLLYIAGYKNYLKPSNSKSSPTQKSVAIKSLIENVQRFAVTESFSIA